MDVAERERLIAQIMCRDVLVTVSTKDGTSIPFFLHPPNPREQAQAANIYCLEYQKGLEQGLSNENDLINNMIELGRDYLKNIDFLRIAQKLMRLSANSDI
jgi:hypothetical protein